MIDDDDAARVSLRRMLRRLGYSVFDAADGLEGLEVFSARRAEVQCVVLDLNMPRLGGEEAFARLRAQAPDVPIVIATGMGAEGAAERLLAAPHTEFVSKPFGLATLQAAISEAVAP